MADSAGKRMREARKRRKLEIKAERKRLRKAGLLGNEPGIDSPPADPTGEAVNPVPPAPPTEPSPS